MNQDQLIRFLIDNLDADAFSAAKRDGTSIMYLAGVAQRMSGGINLNQPQTAPRQNRPTARNVAQEVPQPVQDLNEDTPTPPNGLIVRAPQRNTPVRNNTINQQDRVRVSAL